MPVTCCRTCGAPILFCKTIPAGKLMPVTATPAPDGNIMVFGEECRTLNAEDLKYIREVNPKLSVPIPLYVCHFAQCKGKAESRRK